MSGIFSSSPALRLCVLTSINWYFLKQGKIDQHIPRCVHYEATIRDHFLEALHCLIHLRTRGDIIFNLVHEWCVWNAPRIGAGSSLASCVLAYRDGSIVWISSALTFVLRLTCLLLGIRLGKMERPLRLKPEEALKTSRVGGPGWRLLLHALTLPQCEIMSIKISSHEPLLLLDLSLSVTNKVSESRS